jgi:hypothetical protein
MADQSRFAQAQRGACPTLNGPSDSLALALGWAGGSLRQCAWCWLVVDNAGTYSIQPSRKIKSATHGICPGCKEAMRAEIESCSSSTGLVRAA